jgi:hypothetical protein
MKKQVPTRYYHSVRKQYNVDCNILARSAIEQVRKLIKEGDTRDMGEIINTCPAGKLWRQHQAERAKFIDTHEPATHLFPLWNEFRAAIKKMKGDPYTFIADSQDKFFLPFYTDKEQNRLFNEITKIHGEI